MSHIRYRRTPRLWPALQAVIALLAFNVTSVYATIQIPTPLPTPQAYDVNYRTHTETQTAWLPEISNPRYAATCEILSQPTHGTATCFTFNTSKNIIEPGAYMPSLGYVGADSFQYRVLFSGQPTNAATASFQVAAPCKGSGCYSLTRLGNLAQIPRAYSDIAINDKGELAGSASYRDAATFADSNLAFFWSPTTGQFKILNDLLALAFGYRPLSGSFIGINNSSQIATFFSDTSWPYTSGGHYVINPYTESVSGPSPYFFGDKRAPINNAGQVLLSGGQILSYTNVYYATYLWDPIPNLAIDLSAETNYPTQSQQPKAVDVNDSGQVTGFGIFPNQGLGGAFFWDKTNGFKNLGRFGDWPIAMNNNGDVVVVGFPFSLNTYLYPETFLWSSAAGLVELGYLSSTPRNSYTPVSFLRTFYQHLPEFVSRPFSYPVGINDSSTVIGISSSDFDSYSFLSIEPSVLVATRFAEPFVSTPSSGMMPLFLRMDATGAGWLVEPRAINNRGQIVGVGLNANSTQPELVLLNPVSAPNAENIAITAISGQTATWAPLASDLNGDPITCRLGTPPANGIATIASNCSSGTYQSNPGFIGIDSFTYIANDGRADSNPGTVTVAVTEPLPTDLCLAQYPVSSFSQIGKQGTLTINFTGNIVSYTNKAVKVCPGTPLTYNATSTQGPVVCRVKHNTTLDNGALRINDEIKCTDKPVGKDKMEFKVKSGVSR